MAIHGSSCRHKQEMVLPLGVWRCHLYIGVHTRQTHHLGPTVLNDGSKAVPVKR